jgi:hypothetical protein
MQGATKSNSRALQALEAAWERGTEFALEISRALPASRISATRQLMNKTGKTTEDQVVQDQPRYQDLLLRALVRTAASGSSWTSSTARPPVN